MSKRKSPIRHGVSSYTREDGTQVTSYDRGRGVRRNSRGKRVVVRRKFPATITRQKVESILDKSPVVMIDDSPYKLLHRFTDKREKDRVLSELVRLNFSTKVIYERAFGISIWSVWVWIEE